MPHKLIMVVAVMVVFIAAGRGLVSADSGSSSLELRKVRNLRTIIEVYIREHRKVPSNLNDLRDYMNLPELLQPETDPLGSFSDRYAFLKVPVEVTIPGEASRQLIMVSLNQFLNGKRAAVWRYSNGEYDSGLIDENKLQAGLKDFDFTKLGPMGGGVPAPTHPFPDAPITEYQAKVLQLVREGKITPQPRTPEGKLSQDVGSSSAVAAGSPVSKISPAPTTPSTATTVADGARRTVLWPWMIGILVFMAIATLLWKARH